MAFDKNTSMGKKRVALQQETQIFGSSDQEINPSAVDNENVSTEEQGATEEPGED